MARRPPLEGATALITGASSGIGRAMALQMAPLSRALVLVARRRDRLDALAAELKQANPDLTVQVQPCDLSVRDQVDAMLTEVEQRVGGVDILINNAGFGDFQLFDQADWDKLEQMMQVNMVALTYLTRRLVQPMIQRRRGGVLNISSGFGLTFMPGFATYAGTKHYVTAFSESLRIELADTGVVVSQVCPGPVSTEFEEVAGNPTGKAVPRAIQLTADECARWALRGFSKGRPLIVPGRLMGLLINLGRVTPRPVMRMAWRSVGGLLRRRALAAEASPAPLAQEPPEPEQP